MRFIGSKRNLLGFLEEQVGPHTGRGAFCDLFAGTAIVGRHFKKKGFTVFSTDLLYFSYVLQKTYLELNQPPPFSSLIPHLKNSKANPESSNAADFVIEYLNRLKGREGFIFRNYTPKGTRGTRHVRRYLTPENGEKIDAIRLRIKRWHSNGWIDDAEQLYLICALIEAVPYVSNISGTYAAFLKTWDARAHKSITLIPPEISPRGTKHMAANDDALDFVQRIKDVHTLYLDPPYNSRQYAPNYHLLETIARYDNPSIRGVSGMREYSNQKSQFCNRVSAQKALDEIIDTAKCERVLLSYNSEGLLSNDDILSILRRHGKVTVHKHDYSRYKSNSNGPGHKNVCERLYTLKCLNPRNNLNDLSGREWLYFLNSVETSAYPTKGEQGMAHDLRKLHPSPKPPQLMQKFVEFFTKEGDWVLDPFMGVGGTLIACSLSKRKATGIDLSHKYIKCYEDVCRKLKIRKQRAILGDSANLKKLLPKAKKFDFILTDPPYGEMLSNVRSGQFKKDTGVSEATPFSADGRDLGNMERMQFLEELRGIIAQSVSVLKPKGYLAIFCKDLQPKGKSHNMLHHSVTEALLTIPELSFRGYKIWVDNTSKLYPFGYPHAFVANQLHQFILIFRKEA